MDQNRGWEPASRRGRRVVAAASTAAILWRETVVNMWVEFRTHLLPWLLAAAVIGLLSYQEQRRTIRFNELLLRQAQAIEAQNNLLATQGYLVPPTLPLDALEFGGFESR